MYKAIKSLRRPIALGGEISTFCQQRKVPRFGDLQITYLEKPHVGRHLVAALYKHNIARHKQLNCPLITPSANHLDRGVSPPFKFLMGRALGPLYAAV